MKYPFDISSHTLHIDRISTATLTIFFIGIKYDKNKYSRSILLEKCLFFGLWHYLNFPRFLNFQTYTICTVVRCSNPWSYCILNISSCVRWVHIVRLYNLFTSNQIKNIVDSQKIRVIIVFCIEIQYYNKYSISIQNIVILRVFFEIEQYFLFYLGVNKLYNHIIRAKKKILRIQLASRIRASYNSARCIRLKIQKKPSEI